MNEGSIYRFMVGVEGTLYLFTIYRALPSTLHVKIYLIFKIAL